MIMETAWWRVFLVLAIIGLGLSSYLTVVSFVAADLSFCEVDSSFSCDEVIRSQYSRILGIPVALIGAVGFGLLFIIAYVALISEEESFALLPATVALSVIGLGFGAYLTYLELFVIESVCLLCLASFLIILPMAILGVTGLLRRRRGSREPR